MSFFGFNKKRELSSYRLSLIITHVPTGYTVEFPAFLDMFSDAFTQTWNSEDVYGRMDPIATFINTRRAISLAWNVPAQSYYDAQSNLKKVNELMSFMYPLYENESPGGATAINQAPLLRIKFGNLVQNAQTGDGLLGYVNGFTFDPDLTQGMFYQEGSGRGNSSTGAEYYPKTFRLNAELNVLHEHSLGFRRSNEAGTSFSYTDDDISNVGYPYAVSEVPAGFTTDKTQSYPVDEIQLTESELFGESAVEGAVARDAEVTKAPDGTSQAITPTPKPPNELPGTPQASLGGAYVIVNNDNGTISQRRVNAPPKTTP